MEENEIKEVRRKIITNNGDISYYLKENEDLVKQLGLNPPESNYTFDSNNDKIQFPSGYIRTTEYFEKKYFLKNIVKKNHIRKNIEYCLQLTDYYNFLFNRFYIWGSIETMLYKNAIIIVVSVIEALILESVNNIQDNCGKCSKIGGCGSRFNKEDRKSMKKSLDKLCNLEILHLEKDDIDRIKAFYNLRNNIHIRSAKENEFISDAYTCDVYNELLKSLFDICTQLNDYAVKYYNKCLLDN